MAEKENPNRRNFRSEIFQNVEQKQTKFHWLFISSDLFETEEKIHHYQCTEEYSVQQ